MILGNKPTGAQHSTDGGGGVSLRSAGRCMGGMGKAEDQGGSHWHADSEIRTYCSGTIVALLESNYQISTGALGSPQAVECLSASSLSGSSFLPGKTAK